VPAYAEEEVREQEKGSPTSAECGSHPAEKQGGEIDELDEAIRLEQQRKLAVGHAQVVCDR